MKSDGNISKLPKNFLFVFRALSRIYEGLLSRWNVNRLNISHCPKVCSSRRLWIASELSLDTFNSLPPRFAASNPWNVKHHHFLNMQNDSRSARMKSVHSDNKETSNALLTEKNRWERVMRELNDPFMGSGALNNYRAEDSSNTWTSLHTSLERRRTALRSYMDEIVNICEDEKSEIDKAKHKGGKQEVFELTTWGASS